MIPLRCTVRGCEGRLERTATTLRCPSGHAFDRAREGYWNLLQPQDRRSARPGDSAAAVEARSRWLARGLADGLLAAMASVLDRLALAEGAAAVDLGCGEGTFAGRLLATRAAGACGIDLSVRAVRLAARRFPGVTWIVANAERTLPLFDASVDLALSVFGRRHGAEVSRVLRPGGSFLVVVPGEDDLIELRQAAQGRGERRPRAEAAARALEPALALAGRSAWRERALLDRQALRDALAMTYRGARRSELERLRGIEEIEVTLSAELLVFRRVGPFQ